MHPLGAYGGAYATYAAAGIVDFEHFVAVEIPRACGCSSVAGATVGLGACEYARDDPDYDGDDDDVAS